MAATIAKRTGLPLEFWDERMSTARALTAIWEQGGSTRGRKAEVDALAASVLLQHFLDARKNRAEGRRRRGRRRLIRARRSEVFASLSALVLVLCHGMQRFRRRAPG